MRTETYNRIITQDSSKNMIVENISQKTRIKQATTTNSDVAFSASEKVYFNNITRPFNDDPNLLKQNAIYMADMYRKTKGITIVNSVENPIKGKISDATKDFYKMGGLNMQSSDGLSQNITTLSNLMGPHIPAFYKTAKLNEFVDVDYSQNGRWQEKGFIIVSDLNAANLDQIDGGSNVSAIINPVYNEIETQYKFIRVTVESDIISLNRQSIVTGESDILQVQLQNAILYLEIQMKHHMLVGINKKGGLLNSTVGNIETSYAPLKGKPLHKLPADTAADLDYIVATVMGMFTLANKKSGNTRLCSKMLLPNEDFVFLTQFRRNLGEGKTIIEEVKERLGRDYKSQGRFYYTLQDPKTELINGTEYPVIDFIPYDETAYNPNYAQDTGHKYVIYSTENRGIGMSMPIQPTSVTDLQPYGVYSNSFDGGFSFKNTNIVQVSDLFVTDTNARNVYIS